MSGSRKRAHTPGTRGGGKQKKTDAVEVVCRLTPYSGSDPCLAIVDDNIVKCFAPSGIVQRNGQPYADKYFEFARVFDQTETQSEVFKQCAGDLIEHLITGRNGLLFTYGVTGSGKTYTMTGNATRNKCGVLPRTLDTIFNSIYNRVDKCVFYPSGRNSFSIRPKTEAANERRQDKSMTSDIRSDRYIDPTRIHGYRDDYACAVFVSYFEIYNNACYDLLDNSSGMPRPLDIHFDDDRLSYVAGLNEVEVDSADEALSLLAHGDDRRSKSDTLLNKESSRSHTVFNIRLVMAPCQDRDFYPVLDSTRVQVGQLSLVDLAGSERAKRTLNTGQRLNEAANINKNLMVLRQCFEKLRRNQRSALQETVPYRDSKLTFLFKNYFEGSGKVRMIICANPKPDDYEENLNVLSFAEESQSLRVKQADIRLETEGPRPPVPRRFFVAWNNEVDSYLSNMARTQEAIPKLSWDLKDENDEATVANLRRTVGEMLAKSKQEEEEHCRIFGELENSMRSILCVVDYEREEKEEMQKRMEEEAQTLARTQAMLKRYKRENDNLLVRLSQYEEYNDELVRTEEELRREKKAQKESRRAQKATMEEALELISSPSVAQLRSRFTNAEDTTTSTVPTMSSTSTESRRREGRNDRPGFYNPKYQRRSQSAPRIVDHQPLNRIPTGNVLRPKMPPNSRATTAPRPDMLKSSSGYILTHQEVDEEGNVSTSLVKGECIPTAGGGTAVCFSDIETLRHTSPTKTTTRL